MWLSASWSWVSMSSVEWLGCPVFSLLLFPDVHQWSKLVFRSGKAKICTQNTFWTKWCCSVHSKHQKKKMVVAKSFREKNEVIAESSLLLIEANAMSVIAIIICFSWPTCHKSDKFIHLFWVVMVKGADWMCEGREVLWEPDRRIYNFVFESHVLL